MPRSKIVLFLLLTVAVMMYFAACTPKEVIPPEETVYTYEMTAQTADDLASLDQYPNLTAVDLRGSDCYDAILAYIEAHPTVEVTYDIALGGERYDPTVSELTLADGEYALDDLLDVLKYLPDVTAIHLPKTTLTVEQIESISTVRDDLAVSYTVMLLDQEIDGDITELDLSHIEASQFEEITPALQALPQLCSVKLMAEDGTSKLTMTEVKELMRLVPFAAVHYEFELFGTKFTTADERMEFVKVKILDEGTELIRQALDIMPNCTYLKVDRCGVKSSVMAAIREDYPGVKVSWRIFFGKFNALTDDTMLRLTNGLNDNIVGDLKYFNDVMYLDIGHNETLSDVSFLKYMPELKILILSGSIVSDISSLENHQNIEFLELCYCTWLKDVSVLATCPNLNQVNISFTQVSDISVFDNNAKERFCALGLRISWDEQMRFGELHPDCMWRFDGEQCFGYCWRYDDTGYTFSEYYKRMREIFMYDDVAYYSGRLTWDVYY